MIDGLHLKQVLYGIVIIISVALGLLVFKTVDVKPSNIPIQEFSAERAFSQALELSQNPHPIGSEEIEKVRQYIISELLLMGLTPELQRTEVQDYFRINNSEPVEIVNIFAEIPGVNSTGSIILSGHYDTVPASPGANDDSSAISTLLETARCLLVNQPLQNDVILLFTDAEEPGQFRYGARHFVENYESIDNVRLVLNFESIGRTGPSIMFETAPGNDWLIEGLVKATSHPVAFSFMTDLYRLIAKGGTDFIAFEEVGINGMDFAYSFERTGYHTALDNIESLDKRSLQHHGDYALNLAQYFGDMDLSNAGSDKDTVFHSIVGNITINYPSSWGVPLVIFAGAVLIWLMVEARRKSIASIKGISIGALLFLTEILGITIFLTLAWWGIDEIHLAFGTVVEPTIKAHMLFVGFLVLTIALMIGTRTWLLKHWSPLGIALGTLVTWWILALLAILYLPGFSPIVIWPLLSAYVPLGWLLIKHNSESKSWLYLASVCASALVSIVLMTAPIYLLFQAMGTASPGFSGSPSFPIIGVSIFFWVLLLGLLLPHIDIFGNWKQKKILLRLLMITGVCLLIGSIIPGIGIEKFGLIN